MRVQFLIMRPTGRHATQVRLRSPLVSYHGTDKLWVILKPIPINVDSSSGSPTDITQMTTTASFPKVDGLAGDARCGWCDGECSECAEVLVRLVQTRMWPRPSLWVPY